jgi:hypothetical protein
MKKAITILVVLILLGACTSNQRARKFGGTATHKLPANRKLINVTWKQDDMWILTRPMSATDQAEKYEFKESSSFGVMEGTVTIEEVKQ